MNFQDLNSFLTSPVGSLATSAAGGAVSAGLGILANRQAQRYNAREAEKERAFARQQMQAQMYYNSPVHQAAMMRSAGLNLQGDSIGPMSATPTSGAAAVAPTPPSFPSFAPSGSFAEFLTASAALKNADANMLNAETNAGEQPSRIAGNEAAASRDTSEASVNRATERLKQQEANKAEAEALYQKMVNEAYPQVLAHQFQLQEAEAENLIKTASAAVVSANAQYMNAVENSRHNKELERIADQQMWQDWLTGVAERNIRFEELGVAKQNLVLAEWQTKVNGLIDLYTNQEDISQRDRSLWVNQVRAALGALVSYVGATRALKFVKQSKFAEKLLHAADGKMMDKTGRLVDLPSFFNVK